MGEVPEWLATGPDVQSRMRAWAAERGLRYDAAGLLPPASDHLRRGRGVGQHQAGVQHGRGAVRVLRNTRLRPERFSENLCTGTLPGGLDGTLAQHTFLFYESDHDWGALCDTVVLARVPEVTRLTRGLTGIPRHGRPRNLVVTARDYGADTREVTLAEGLDRIVWEVDADEDPEPLRAAFTPEVVAALSAAPEGTRVSMCDGWLSVELPEFDHPAEDLDALCRAAAALANGVRSAAERLPTLAPGSGPVAEPADTPYRRWVREGAARLTWPSPPPDVTTAIGAYLPAAAEDARGRRRSVRAALVLFALIVGVSLVAIVPIWLQFGAVAGGSGLAAVSLFALFIALRGRSDIQDAETSERAQAWGREAFATSYAAARGLRVEDPEELRRQLPPILAGRPEFGTYGELADGVEGRILFWRDRSDPATANHAADVALVAAPPGPTPAATPPYRTVAADPWLAVVHDLGTGSRAVAGLDALAAEAARLAGGAR